VDGTACSSWLRSAAKFYRSCSGDLGKEVGKEEKLCCVGSEGEVIAGRARVGDTGCES